MLNYPYHAAAKATISQHIVAAGMQQAQEQLTGQPSTVIFYGGGVAQVARALNSVCMLPWVRPRAGMADVGDFWVITPQASNKEPIISQYAPPFHA